MVGWGEWGVKGELLFNGYRASFLPKEKQFCGWTVVRADERVLNTTDHTPIHFFFLLARLCNSQDLSFPTRYRTGALSNKSTES